MANWKVLYMTRGLCECVANNLTCGRRKITVTIGIPWDSDSDHPNKQKGNKLMQRFIYSIKTLQYALRRGVITSKKSTLLYYKEMWLVKIN